MNQHKRKGHPYKKQPESLNQAIHSHRLPSLFVPANKYNSRKRIGWGFVPKATMPNFYCFPPIGEKVAFLVIAEVVCFCAKAARETCCASRKVEMPRRSSGPRRRAASSSRSGSSSSGGSTKKPETTKQPAPTQQPSHAAHQPAPAPAAAPSGPGFLQRAVRFYPCNFVCVCVK